MSDNLPPLPEPLIMSMVASSRDLRYTADQLRAYGQQCRAQALEEAALRFEREREIDQDEIERLIVLRRNDARALDAERAGRAAAVLAMREAAAELERHKPLMQAVEWLLDDGHMNQEHLARLRAAFEAA